MLRGRGKSVRVCIVDGLAIAKSKPTAAEMASSGDDKSDIDVSLAIKLATLIFVVTQGALLMYGYSTLVGNYEQYGIDINELDMGKPTLLLYGYIFSLSTIFEASQRIPYAGSLTLIMMCLIVGALFVYALANKAPISTRIGVLFAISLPLVFISITPASGISRGMNVANSEMKKFVTTSYGGRYEAQQMVTTDDGEKLTGKLILADSRLTFLLTKQVQGDCAIRLVVYKLSNANNRVMRRTVLTAVEPDQQPMLKDCKPKKGHEPNLVK